jgi:hypothetical protein
MIVNINPITIPNWRQRQTSNVEFRVYPNASFIDSSGAPVNIGDYYRWDVTVGTTTIADQPVQSVTIPATWLYSTLDALVNSTATYSAGFYDKASGRVLESPDLFQNFFLPAFSTTANWSDIIRLNQPLGGTPGIRGFDEEARLMIQGLVNSGFSDNFYARWQQYVAGITTQNVRPVTIFDQNALSSISTSSGGTPVALAQFTVPSTVGTLKNKFRWKVYGGAIGTPTGQRTLSLLFDGSSICSLTIPATVVDNWTAELDVTLISTSPQVFCSGVIESVSTTTTRKALGNIKLNKALSGKVLTLQASDDFAGQQRALFYESYYEPLS